MLTILDLEIPEGLTLGTLRRLLDLAETGGARPETLARIETEDLTGGRRRAILVLGDAGRCECGCRMDSHRTMRGFGCWSCLDCNLYRPVGRPPFSNAGLPPR